MVDLLALVCGTAFALSGPAHRFEPVRHARLALHRTSAPTAVLVARVRGGQTSNPRRARSGLPSATPGLGASTGPTAARANGSAGPVWAQRRLSPPRAPPSLRL